MKTSSNLGILLLSIWLITMGIIQLTDITFPASSIVLALIAIAAGVLILLGNRNAKLTKNLGMVLLGIWLIVTGLLPLLNITFPASGTLMAILAVAAGVLILLKR